MNRVIMMGRLVNEPELKSTPNGVNVCSFRLAVDRNFQKKGEDRKSDFFNVVAWRGTAEFISRFFSKGKMILIEGEMTTRQYTDKNGNPATWYEIVVDNAFFTGEKANNGGGSSFSAPTDYGDPPPERGGSGSGSGYGSGGTGSSTNNGSDDSDFSSASNDDYPF